MYFHKVLAAVLVAVLYLERVHGYGYKMTAAGGCSTMMNVGSTLMGYSAQSSSSRSVVVKKNGNPVTAGSTQPNDGSVYTASISSSSGIDYVLQISGAATFQSGHCSNTRVSNQDSAPTTLTMASGGAGGTVSIYAGFASGQSTVYITPTFTFTISGAPTHAPTYLPNHPTPSPTPGPTSPTAIPTTEPSASPTATANTPTYFAQVVFTCSTSSLSGLQGAAGSLSQVVAAHLSIDTALVAVVSVTAAGPTGIAAFLRRILSDQASVTLSVLGFGSQSGAQAALTQLGSYLISASFLSDFGTQTNSAVTLSSVSIVSANVDTSDVSNYAYSCTLSPQLKLFWTMGADASSYKATLKSYVSGGWLSAGVVLDTQTSMVGPSVWLFAPTDPGRAGFYSMTDKTAGGFVRDFSHNLQSVQTTSWGSSMTWTGALPASTSSSNFIYASSDQWPAMHAKGNYGFSTVAWSGGTCRKVGSGKEVSPAWVWLLLFAQVVWKHAPFALLRKLDSTRVPLSFLQDWSISGFFFAILVVGLAVGVVVLDPNTKNNIVSLSTLPTRSGLLSIMCMWLVFLPTSKAWVSASIFGVPLERAVKYHSAVSLLGLGATVVHLVSIILSLNSSVIFLASRYPDSQSGVRPVFGLAAFITIGIMTLFSIPFLRRKISYEVFLAVHSLSLIALVFMITHLNSVYAFGFAPGIILHVIGNYDRLRALFQKRQLLGMVRYGESEAEAVTCLIVPCTSPYSPGQYYFLRLGLEGSIGESWHPVSVSSVGRAASTSVMTFHIKSLGPGSWSGFLAQTALAQSQAGHHLSPLPTPPPRSIAVDGPYGALSVQPDEYTNVLLVAGGIGITALLPIAEHIVERIRRTGSYGNTQTLRLVWSVREADTLAIFKPRLLALASEELIVVAGGAGSPRTIRDTKYTSAGSRGDACLDLSVSIHLTGSGAERDAESSSGSKLITVSITRPDIEASVRQLGSNAGSCCALVCGPANMQNETVRVARTLGVAVHSETFGW